MVGSFRTGGHDAGWSDGSGCGCLEPLMKYPLESLTLIAPEKLPQPNRKVVVFQPSFFRGEIVKLQGCKRSTTQNHTVEVLGFSG